MVIVVVVAHWPAEGVNVYVVVAVLFIAGDHVPVKPLLDVVGKGANAAPEHMGATWVKVGTVVPPLGVNTTLVLALQPEPSVAVRV